MINDEHEAIIRARYQAYHQACDNLRGRERWMPGYGNHYAVGPYGDADADADAAAREAELTALRAAKAKALAKLLRALHDAGMGNAAPEGI